MALSRRLRIWWKRCSYGRTGRGPDGERIVARLGVERGMRVADIGSGFGDFAVRFANAVGPDGAVYAIDTDVDLRMDVARTADQLGLTQLVPTAASADDPGIPGDVDLVFLSSSFHHLPDQVRYFERVAGRLSDRGRVAILEPRPGLTTGWFGHATRPEQVRATLEAAGFRLVDRADILRWAPLQVFELARPSSDDA